jgi:hypothetical protein
MKKGMKEGKNTGERNMLSTFFQDLFGSNYQWSNLVMII